MTLEFLQVDVFADEAFRGNPLAVFPDASGLTREQMQTIASEMNLSETSFVTGADDDSYSVRIFTPQQELGFAGHPTIGSAWVLQRLGRISGSKVRQRSEAGSTEVTLAQDKVWFRRTGRAFDDLRLTDPGAESQLARALGIEVSKVGLEPRELGRSVDRLRPAESDAGLRHLVVPVADLDALSRCRPNPGLLSEINSLGCYCFTAVAAGAVRARGFFPALGIAEDPATGSAAASLGLYLSRRVGAIDFEVVQGVELARPSRISVKAHDDSVDIGGRCELILEGRLLSVP